MAGRFREPTAAALTVAAVLIVRSCVPGAPPARWMMYASTFSVISSPSDPGACGGIVSITWLKSSLIGRPPHAPVKLGPVSAGASLRTRQIGPMASGATDVVGGAAGVGLPLRIRASWLLLCCRDGDDDRHENGSG